MTSEQPLREVRRLFESTGYTLTRINGSHHIFTKPGRNPISIPVHKNR